MILTDPFELIKAMPPGSALYGRAGESQDKIETCILLREDEKQIQKIPANPIIELRTGIWDNHVCLMAVMIKLAGLPYETWWNYHQKEGHGEIVFNDMIFQSTIPILIYDHQKKRRSVMVRNSLSSTFKANREKILSKPPWSMKDFDAAREKIVYSQYTSVQALWDALG